MLYQYLTDFALRECNLSHILRNGKKMNQNNSRNPQKHLCSQLNSDKQNRENSLLLQLQVSYQHIYQQYLDQYDNKVD